MGGLLGCRTGQAVVGQAAAVLECGMANGRERRRCTPGRVPLAACAMQTTQACQGQPLRTRARGGGERGGKLGAGLEERSVAADVGQREHDVEGGHGAAVPILLAAGFTRGRHRPARGGVAARRVGWQCS